MKKTSSLFLMMLVFCVYPQTALMAPQIQTQNCVNLSLVSKTISENMSDTAIIIATVFIFVICMTLAIIGFRARAEVLRKAQKYDELMEEREEQKRRGEGK